MAIDQKSVCDKLGVRKCSTARASRCVCESVCVCVSWLSLTDAGLAVRVQGVLLMAATHRTRVRVVTRVLAAAVPVVTRHWRGHTHMYESLHVTGEDTHTCMSLYTSLERTHTHVWDSSGLSLTTSSPMWQNMLLFLQNYIKKIKTFPSFLPFNHLIWMLYKLHIILNYTTQIKQKIINIYI